MTLRTFLIVALLAVVSVLVAMTGLNVSPRTGEKTLFPGISENINNIASFSVHSVTGSITVKRSPQGWYLEEWDGYPADVSKIRAMVTEMIRAVLLEPKTADVRRHALLELADPAADFPADGRGRELTLRDENGNVVTSIILGRRRSDLGGADTGVYVRRTGEAQTWLARTGLFPTADLRSWIEPTVIGLDSARLAHVTLRHPQGQTIRVTQQNNGTPTTVHTLPPTNTKVDANATHRVLALLSHITFENVRKSHAHAISEMSARRDATRVYLTTQEGLKINLTAYNSREGATWLALTANSAATNNAVNTEADTLHKRHHGWLYQVPSSIAAAFHTLPEDLMQRPEPISPKEF